MIVLGVNAFGENPSACLVREGVLLACCQEERLNRLKGSHGLFPSKAVSWCLSSQGLKLQDVQAIAFAWDCGKYPWTLLKRLVITRFKVRNHTYAHRSSIQYADGRWPAVEYLYGHTRSAFSEKVRDELRVSGHKGPIPPIEFVEHHLAHAYQAYFHSPFPNAAVLVVDGSGEEKCVSGYHARDGAISPVFCIEVPQSLGWYYGAFTAYLGFRANQDEGKLMGLASLGEGRKHNNPWMERMDRIIRITHDGFELDPVFFKFGQNEFHPRFTDELYRFITSFDSSLEPVALDEKVDVGDGTIYKYQLRPYIDLAYAVQDRLEAALIALAKRLLRETGESNLCMAGGVAMNCKANGAILDQTSVENIFIHPASSDDGSSIGAAFAVAAKNARLVRDPLQHVQLGPSYSNGEIERVLHVAQLDYTTPPDICDAAAELLARGQILAWFHGGLEMGARALGGRSIVACPGEPGMKEVINRRVKFREEWRPYCPSLPLKAAGQYLENSVEAPFMILARQAKSALANCAPSTVHVDGSVRPQTVRPEVLPQWHRLLKCVEQRCGSPVLLNTSFNMRGEPIVCSPHDALRTFFCTGLDAMVLEDHLIRKHA